MSERRITGDSAIIYAEHAGAQLRKFADPHEAERDISPDEARAIVRDDPAIVYVDFTDDDIATVRRLGTEAGALFAETFPGEELDWCATDWDAVAWEGDGGATLYPGACEVAWRIYQAAMIEETSRLLRGFTTPAGTHDNLGDALVAARKHAEVTMGTAEVFNANGTRVCLFQWTGNEAQDSAVADLTP